MTRTRRTSSDIQAIREAMYDICQRHRPLTVRAVFYRLLSEYPDMIDKTEGEYRRVVSRLLGEMREQNELPWTWIVDNSRVTHFYEPDDSPEQFVQDMAVVYRRDLWRGMRTHVEVWCEKDAMTGVLEPVCDRWRVPLVVVRGFASKTMLMEAANRISQRRKPCRVIYVGDHDPSGVTGLRALERTLRDYIGRSGSPCSLTAKKLFVTEAQIRQYALPTRPTKQSNHNDGTFVGDSVEVDALPPEVVRRGLERAILLFLDRNAVSAELDQERREREGLERLADLNLMALSVDGQTRQRFAL